MSNPVVVIGPKTPQGPVIVVTVGSGGPQGAQGDEGPPFAGFDSTGPGFLYQSMLGGTIGSRTTTQVKGDLGLGSAAYTSSTDYDVAGAADVAVAALAAAVNTALGFKLNSADLNSALILSKFTGTQDANHWVRGDGTLGTLPPSNDASAITTGLLGTAYGGTHVDSHAWTGFPYVIGGDWGVRTIAEVKGDLGLGSAAYTSSSAYDVAGAADAAADVALGAAQAYSSIASNLTSGTVPLGVLSGITTAQLDAAAGITSGQLAGGIDAAKISSGGVSNTEFNFLDGVTSAIQTQLNSKAVLPTGTTDSTTFYRGDGVFSNALTGVFSVAGLSTLSGGLTVGTATIRGNLLQSVSAGGAQLALWSTSAAAYTSGSGIVLNGNTNGGLGQSTYFCGSAAGANHYFQANDGSLAFQINEVKCQVGRQLGVTGLSTLTGGAKIGTSSGIVRDITSSYLSLCGGTDNTGANGAVYVLYGHTSGSPDTHYMQGREYRWKSVDDVSTFALLNSSGLTLGGTGALIVPGLSTLTGGINLPERIRFTAAGTHTSGQTEILADASDGSLKLYAQNTKGIFGLINDDVIFSLGYTEILAAYNQQSWAIGKGLGGNSLYPSIAVAASSGITEAVPTGGVILKKVAGGSLLSLGQAGGTQSDGSWALGTWYAGTPDTTKVGIAGQSGLLYFNTGSTGTVRFLNAGNDIASIGSKGLVFTGSSTLDSTLSGMTCDGAAGSVSLSVPTAKVIFGLVANAKLFSLGQQAGVVASTSWAIGAFGSGVGADNTKSGILGTINGISMNAPNLQSIYANVAGSEVSKFSASGLDLSTNSKAVIFGAAGTVTAGSNMIVGTSAGMAYNAVSTKAHSFQVAGVEQIRFYLGGITQFASGLGTTSGSVISLLSDSAGYLTANCLTGGAFRVKENNVVIADFSAGVVALGNGGGALINFGTVGNFNSSANMISGASTGMKYNAGSGLSHLFYVAGVLNSTFGTSFATAGAGAFAIGPYAVGTFDSTKTGIAALDLGTIYHNVPTGQTHVWRIGGTTHASVIAGGIKLGATGTATGANYEVIAQVNGVYINAPTSNGVFASINGALALFVGYNSKTAAFDANSWGIGQYATTSPYIVGDTTNGIQRNVPTGATIQDSLNGVSVAIFGNSSGGIAGANSFGFGGYGVAGTTTAPGIMSDGGNLGLNCGSGQGIYIRANGSQIGIFSAAGLGITGAATVSTTLGVTGLSTLTGGATTPATLTFTGSNSGTSSAAQVYQNASGFLQINGPTAGATIHSINGSEVFRVQSTAINLFQSSGSVIFGAAGTVAGTSNMMIGTSAGPVINAISAKVTDFQVAGVSQLQVGLGGITSFPTSVLTGTVSTTLNQIVNVTGNGMTFTTPGFFEFRQAGVSVAQIASGMVFTALTAVSTSNRQIFASSVTANLGLNAPSGTAIDMFVAGVLQTRFGLGGVTSFASGLGTIDGTKIQAISASSNQFNFGVPSGGLFDYEINAATQLQIGLGGIRLFGSGLGTNSPTLISLMSDTFGCLTANVPTSGNFPYKINGVTQFTGILGGFSFASGLGTTSGSVISLLSDAANFLCTNVPTGGAATFKVNAVEILRHSINGLDLTGTGTGSSTKTNIYTDATGGAGNMILNCGNASGILAVQNSGTTGIAIGGTGGIQFRAAYTGGSAVTQIIADGNAGNLLFGVPTGKYNAWTVNGVEILRHSINGLSFTGAGTYSSALTQVFADGNAGNFYIYTPTGKAITFGPEGNTRLQLTNILATHSCITSLFNGVVKIGSANATLVSTDIQIGSYVSNILGSNVPTGGSYDRKVAGTTVETLSASALTLAAGIKLSLGGAVTTTFTNKVANYSVGSSDYKIYCAHATVPITVTLPAATGTGRELYIKNTGVQDVTVTAQTGELVETTLTQTLTTGQSLSIQDAGTGQWWIIS
jgi:hypothetical protein